MRPSSRPETTVYEERSVHQTSDSAHLTTWLEISRRAYAHNLQLIRRLVGPDVEIGAVVKANGYGHGLERVAQLAVAHGAGSFCVHSLDEALRLRRAGHNQDILVLGQVMKGRLAEAIEAGLTLALFDADGGQALVDACRVQEPDQPVKVHLKIETGTYRQGVSDDALRRLVEVLRDGQHQNSRPIDIEGAYTHFANIEDTTQHDYADQQRQRFDQALQQLDALGIQPRKLHTACSAAALLFPETRFQMVRLGISQYGFWPSRETRLSFQLHGAEPTASLEPVLTWKTRVGQVKWIPEGSFVGYGCSYQVTRRSRLAILPIGYSDGYDRQLSNRGHVLIRGRRAPIRGRICMNLMMVDVTDIPDVMPEDEVVLLGRQGDQQILAEDLAQLIGTIHYEVVARLSAELQRLVVD